MLLLFLVLSFILVGTYVIPTLFIVEKEYGTLKAILASATSLKKIIIAKLLIGMIISFIVPYLILLIGGYITYSWNYMAPALISGSIFYFAISFFEKIY